MDWFGSTGKLCPGVPCEEDGPPRTRSGEQINSVVRPSGPNGLGGPGDKDRPPWTGSDKPVNGVVRTPGRMGRVAPVMGTARPDWI